LPFLFGFTIIALIEKIIYKRIQVKELKRGMATTKASSQVLDDIKGGHGLEAMVKEEAGTEAECLLVEEKTIFEGIALVSHGLVIGLLVSLVYETYQEITYIVLIPFFIREFTLGFSTEQIYEDLKGKKATTIQVLSIIMPFVGASLGLVLVLNKIALYTILATSLGLILYIVVRDMIPLGKKGKPLYFLFGVVLAVSIFLLFELVILT